MSALFNPQQLTPDASLNRVKLGPMSWEPGVPGKTAYDLLSLQALTDELVQHAQVLGLTQHMTERALLPHVFDRCFEAGDPTIRANAEAIAQRFGRRVGYVIATLKRGELASRQARPEWDDSYWKHWSQIRQVWLGGGLVAGHFGHHMCASAQAELTANAVTPCRLQVAGRPALLPLVGAARSSARTTGATLVFDFGQSFIKRARATYRDGTLMALRLLPPVPVLWNTICLSTQTEREQAQSVAMYMSEVIADTWRHVNRQVLEQSTVIIASVASYVIDNHPLPRQGGPYAQLHILADNAGDWVAAAASSSLGQKLMLTLLHDGTAAARTYAGEEYAAVIMLGTALGIGFPPRAHGLRPIDPGFNVEAD